MPDEMVTDEIGTVINSSDAQSAEEFLFGHPANGAPAEEIPCGDDADDADARNAEEQDADTETAGEPDVASDAGEQAGPVDELKVVLSIRGGRAIIGVQQPSADPHIESFDYPDLSGLAQMVPAVVERARARWEEEPKFPAHERPAPPARRQRQRRQEPAQAATAEEGTDQQQPETLRLF